MKNFLLFVFVSAIIGVGCSKQEKGCMTVQPQDEVPQILAFGAANGLQLTKDSSGVYYQIIDSGTGVFPTIKDTISVSYIGKLLNGNTFSQSTVPTTYALDGVIEGWEIGIPLIKKGGRIKMVIPSAYAYGCNAQGPVPSNAVLYFDVTLVDFFR